MTPAGERDRTRDAVLRWLAALPAAAYDLRLVPADGEGPALCRRLDAAGVLRVLPWARARNAAGHHVYCRPLAARHVLVDDLCPDTLEELSAAHRLAAVVETSPWSFQAWVTLSAAEVPIGPGAAAARLLASRFGGDAGAASGVQLGRLPGTTNRKPRHERGDGTYPYALLHRAAAAVDPGGPAILAEVDTGVALMSSPGQETISPLRGAELEPRAGWEAEEARRRILAGLAPGAVLDRSRADYAIARRLLQRGAGAGWAASVVLAGERAHAMPARVAAAYAARTVQAAALAVRRDQKG